MCGSLEICTEITNGALSWVSLAFSLGLGVQGKGLRA